MSELDPIKSLLKHELAEVDTMILQQLESRVPLTLDICKHLIDSGGKRIRPLVHLLAAKACGSCSSKPITVATIIEYIHSASLLHDDVIDQSGKRRGRPTAQVVWGNAAPILVGDFLYSRAFQLMVSLKDMGILELLCESTNVIVEGEVFQLTKKHDPSLTEEEYFSIIYSKTAKLFETSAMLGAVVSPVSPAVARNLGAFGKHLGLAFQLIDDVLDYQSGVDAMGKNCGDDLAEGKLTLPLLYALKNGTLVEQDMIHQAVKRGSLENLESIQKVIISSGAIDYTMAQAQKQISLAKDSLGCLASSPYKEALTQLADYSIQRLN